MQNRIGTNYGLLATGAAIGIFTMLFAAPSSAKADGISQVFDSQITILEHDPLPLAEAMPADKYNFAPANGAFKGVRTFAEQVRHMATLIYMASGAVLGEKPPVDIGKDDNGPAAVKTKAQLVEYLRGAIAYAHKAAQSVNAKNELDDVTMGSEKMKRVAAISMVTWHSFDHFGQMVEYARMNGVVPPSSAPPPPAAKK